MERITHSKIKYNNTVDLDSLPIGVLFIDPLDNSVMVRMQNYDQDSESRAIQLFGPHPFTDRYYEEKYQVVVFVGTIEITGYKGIYGTKTI